MTRIENQLDYNEIVQFMKEFEVDLLNRFGELIIDEPTSTYACINNCKDIDEVKTRVVYNLCRPIGKGLDATPAKRLLNRLNKYFDTDLTKEDMRLMYQELCYVRKLDEFKSFIKRGFPMDELMIKQEEM
ncbi:hypothetical protein JOC34_000600 [Virgibacillus halotolerans]|uniref:hypothetical protein n=1 Tax=Virgibacillus halotolerans TaxID=1071053 RepID=UPI001960D39C|nr:hypothetical protein [Virgibacillus halotolerans]MBM7598243.1 hypothetical protein [Virgibacillus halotolerans]